MVLELPVDHPHNEQTRKKIALLEARIRLAKSSLNSDIRDLSSNGYIRGLARLLADHNIHVAMLQVSLEP